MDKRKLFLKTLKAGINGNPIQWNELLSAQNARDLLKTAEEHSVLPIIVETFHFASALENGCEEIQKAVTKYVRSLVIRQAQKSADFLLFYEYLASNDLHPVVVKGIICRSLYPQPEHRGSVDEDLFIKPEQFPAYHKAILAYGLTMMNPRQDLETADEVSYKSDKNHLYIEVHKYPFQKDSDIFGNMNRLFEKVHVRSVTEVIYGVPIRTMEYTDHLLYLILHCFKHFLHSGFGIRQVCDIALFSKTFCSRINWNQLKAHLEECQTYDFARAIFRIADQELLFDDCLKEYLGSWNLDGIDEQPLLSDIMESGLTGTSTMARLHSSTMTLHAVKESRREPGRKKVSCRVAAVYAVFLPFKDMVPKYPYLKRLPFLIPACWLHRLIYYLIRTGQETSGDSTMDAVHIGQERIQLLREYHII